jgi:hypothetical protein
MSLGGVGGSGSASPLAGRRALVTGASSGIGEALACGLAARGAHVLLAARRRDRLEALATSLRAAHGVEARAIEVDLGRAGGAAALFEDATRGGAAVDILVNNAGLGANGPFAEVDWERIEPMVAVNIAALTELSHRFVRHMLAHGRPSHLVQVGSVAAWQPVPRMAVYAATKAYVRSLADALAHELRGTNVHVIGVHPGPVATEFAEVAGHAIPEGVKRGMMSAERCADLAIRAMLQGRRESVPGVSNRAMTLATRFLPRGLVVRAADLAMRSRRPPRRG